MNNGTMNNATTNNGTMNNGNPLWLQQYRQPFAKRKNVGCHSGHRHSSNMPAVGFVLVRLNASLQLELLLDLRSQVVQHPNTFGFIGGYASSVGEEVVKTAQREAREEYGINPNEINMLGLQYRHDHGGFKHVSYTYVFAEYNPRNGQAPTPKSIESIRSQWFTLDALPNNLLHYITEDLEVLLPILDIHVLPMLLRARNMQPSPAQAPQAPQGLINFNNVGSISSASADEDGDAIMTNTNVSSNTGQMSGNNTNMASASHVLQQQQLQQQQQLLQQQQAQQQQAQQQKLQQQFLQQQAQQQQVPNNLVQYPDLSQELQKISMQQQQVLNNPTSINSANPGYPNLPQQQIIAPQQPPTPEVNKTAVMKPEPVTNKSYFSQFAKFFSSKDRPTTKPAAEPKKTKGKDKQAAPAAAEVATSQSLASSVSPTLSQPGVPATAPNNQNTMPQYTMPNIGALGPMPGSAPIASQTGVPAASAPVVLAPAPVSNNQNMMFVPPPMDAKGPEFASAQT